MDEKAKTPCKFDFYRIYKALNSCVRAKIYGATLIFRLQSNLKL